MNPQTIMATQTPSVLNEFVEGRRKRNRQTAYPRTARTKSINFMMVINGESGRWQAVEIAAIGLVSRKF